MTEFEWVTRELCKAEISLDKARQKPNVGESELVSLKDKVHILAGIKTLLNAKNGDRGEWLDTFPTTPKSYKKVCSECGSVANMIRCKYKFCPWCGREMT